MTEEQIKKVYERYGQGQFVNGKDLALITVIKNIVDSKREWVGLTDEEIAEAVGDPIDSVYLADFRKVEAKLKEKNT